MAALATILDLLCLYLHPNGWNAKGRVRSKREVDVVRHKSASGCVDQAQASSKKPNSRIHMEMEGRTAERKDLWEAWKTWADWRKIEKNTGRACGLCAVSLRAIYSAVLWMAQLPIKWHRLTDGKLWKRGEKEGGTWHRGQEDSFHSSQVVR